MKYFVHNKPIILSNSVKNKEHKQIFVITIGLSIRKLYTDFVNDLETHYAQLEPDKMIHNVGYRMQLQIRNKIKL